MAEKSKESPSSGVRQKDFILVPDVQVFEACRLARDEGRLEQPCAKLFITAWRQYIDGRDKVIYITENLNQYLIDKKFKSPNRRRLALFTVVNVRENFSDCDCDQSQRKLASKLSIEEDRPVYYVTDNTSITEILKKDPPFSVINSKGALKLFEESTDK